ncbi:MAG TPA: MMPL family transporter, partial [Dermatophilaceae bacterium]
MSDNGSNSDSATTSGSATSGDSRIAEVGRLAWFPAGRRSKWAVLIFWLIVAALVAGPAGKLMGAQKNDAVSWLPGSAESTKVIQASGQFLPKNEIPTTVVYERAGGVTPRDLASVNAQVSKFNALQPVVRSSVGPISSRDKKALRVEVPINAGSAGWDKLSAAVTDMRSISTASPAGLSVHFTGAGGVAADSSAAFSGIDGKLLYSALAVVIFILLITYRSPVLWLLPVISAGLALTVAQAVVYLLATKADLTVNAQSAGILTVLVIGAGTDYALLLVARYREELRRHEDRHEAMAFALHRVGPAIFASGATVIAGMLCLLVASMNSTQGLGPVAAVGIGFGLMVMLTLLPALLVIFGRWIFWPVHPTFGTADHTATGVWAKVGGRIARAPRVIWVATSAALLVAGLGVIQLNAVGLQNKDAFFGTPDSVVGEQVLADHFPAGAGQPVMVIAAADQAADVRT